MATQNANVEIVVSSKADTRGFKQAETALDKLNKSVKSLAAGLGVAYGARAVTQFGKASVKAFIADEEAATKLSQAVKNLGMEFANPYIASYIKQLEATSKVADDQLRPAFQSLLQQTGSLAKSQSILNTAIEVSRGSGYDLATVSNDLAQAYVGNTKGLKKYYLGLSTATLKAKSFSDVQDIISKQFSGSSAAYLQTYSGQVGVLSLAWQNFQENVGGALLTMASFGEGSKGGGLSNLATILDKIGGAFVLISKGWNSVASLLNLTDMSKGLLGKFNPYATSAPAAKDEVKSLDKYAAILKQIEDDRIKQNKIILAQNKALTAEQKKQAALKKNNALFDMDQIQLVAALKGQLSAEDRKRAELQLAILQDNSTEAAKLAGEVAKAQGMTEEMVKYYMGLPDAKNPFEAWIKTLKDATQLAKDIAKYTPPNISVQTPSAPPSIAATGSNVLQDIYNASVTAGMSAGAIGDTLRYSAMGQAAMGNPIINVTVQGSVTTQQDLVSAVRDGLLNNSLSGKISTLERSLGTFAP